MTCVAIPGRIPHGSGGGGRANSATRAPAPASARAPPGGTRGSRGGGAAWRGETKPCHSLALILRLRPHAPSPHAHRPRWWVAAISARACQNRSEASGPGPLPGAHQVASPACRCEWRGQPVRDKCHHERDGTLWRLPRSVPLGCFCLLSTNYRPAIECAIGCSTWKRCTQKHFIVTNKLRHSVRRLHWVCHCKRCKYTPGRLWQAEQPHRCFAPSRQSVYCIAHAFTEPRIFYPM